MDSFIDGYTCEVGVCSWYSCPVLEMTLPLLLHLILIVVSCDACFMDSECPSREKCDYDWNTHTGHCVVDNTLIYVFVVAPIVFFTAVAICFLGCKYCNEGPEGFEDWCRCLRRDWSSSSRPTVTTVNRTVTLPVFMPMLSQTSVDSLPPPYAEALASAPPLTQSQDNSCPADGKMDAELGHTNAGATDDSQNVIYSQSQCISYD